MTPHKPFPDPAQAHALLDEADIGSGEKTLAQLETEEIIREIPPLPAAGQDERDDAEDASGDDANQGRARREHDASLERDEPSGDLDSLDPVPPKGS
jgi:hypothetical protein